MFRLRSIYGIKGYPQVQIIVDGINWITDDDVVISGVVLINGCYSYGNTYRLNKETIKEWYPIKIYKPQLKLIQGGKV